MPSSRNDTLLPDDDWNALQQSADRFAEARQHGPVDDWQPYLPPESDRLFRPTLIEIIKIDLELSWRAGRKPEIESYSQKYSEIEPVPVDLMVEEYRARQRAGDNPTIAEYQPRFPAQFADFEKRVATLNAGSIAPVAPPVATPLPPPSAPVAATVRKDVPENPPANAGTPCPEGYRLIQLLGRGNFGEVWKAEGPGGVELALKIVSTPLDNEAAKRESASFELIKKIQHPALLATIGAWIINNRLVIGMELADETLRDRLRKWKQKGQAGIPAMELLHFFREAAEGLDYLHWQGILHRDIKPENILLKQNYAKVADFGLAKAQGGALAPGALMSGSFAGTPAFMAPEVWAGKLSKASDQYSLAFTYAELRLGRRPLPGQNFAEVMDSTLNGVPDLGTIPELEADVLRRGLAKRPEDRFESCREFIKALERAMGVQSIERPSFDGRPVPSSPTATSGEADGSGTIGSTPKVAGKSSRTDKTQVEAGSSPKPAKLNSPSWNQPKGSNKQTHRPPPASANRKIMAIGVGAVVLIGIVIGLVIWKSPGGKASPTVANHPTEPAIQQPTTPNVPATGPEPLKPVLPSPRFRPTSGSEVVTIQGKPFWNLLEYPLKSGKSARFLLMVPTNGEEPARGFYLLETKAWNGLVQDFIDEHSGKIDPSWKPGPPMLPAVNLTLAEAESVARGMGGRLPTAAEWDFAAGFTRRKGDAVGQTQAIASETLLPVDGDPQDLSALKVRNLAGNGREFTSDRLMAGNQEMAVLRGRMSTLSKPLTMADIAAEHRPERTQTQFPTARSKQTGFRIAVDLP